MKNSLQRDILLFLDDWKSENEIRNAVDMEGLGRAGAMAMALNALGRKEFIENRIVDGKYRCTDKGREALSQQ